MHMRYIIRKCFLKQHLDYPTEGHANHSFFFIRKNEKASHHHDILVDLIATYLIDRIILQHFMNQDNKNTRLILHFR